MKSPPDKRPVWDFPQPIHKVRWLAKHCIKSIAYHYLPDIGGGSDDDDSHWILRSPEGEWLRVDPEDEIMEFIVFSTSGSGGIMVKVDAPHKYAGPEGGWFRRLKEIELYDKDHAEELAEYRRLREKFEGVE